MSINQDVHPTPAAPGRDGFAWAREAVAAPDGPQPVPGPAGGPPAPPAAPVRRPGHGPGGLDTGPRPETGGDDERRRPRGAPPGPPPTPRSAGPGPADLASGAPVEPPPWLPPPLSSSLIVHERPAAPGSGWRHLVHAASGGTITPRLSPSEQHRRELIARIRTPLSRAHTITVISMKGGVGKTTVSGVLGLMLAEYRGERTVVLDANPDAGTLADRLVGDEPGPTVRELITELPRITAPTDLNRYTRLAGRLHVVPSEQDPAMSEQFDQAEYEAVVGLLQRFFDILITDSGTGVVHSAMTGALRCTDQLVIVGAPTVDAASRAAKTLDWLIQHGFEQKVREAVVALSCDRRSPDVDRAMIHDHFAERCRAVVEIPPDPHLATGGRIDLPRLAQPTRDGALELTAHVADAFRSHHPGHRPSQGDPGWGR